MLTEACQPYATGRRLDVPEPVSIWTIIDRLNRDEQREMVMAFAIHTPVLFEDKLMRIQQERRP